MPESIRRLSSLPRTPQGIGIVAVTLGCVAVGLYLLNPYYVHVMILTALMVIFAITIRPLLLAGEASFCHGAFYAIGAYTVGILTVEHGWSVWLALPVAGVISGLTAVLIGIPSLRTTGSYFFLITFCFLIVTNSVIQYSSGLTGGHGGIPGIPKPAGLSEIGDMYVLSFVVACLVALLFLRLDRSRWGLELRALGDSSALAQAAGISRFGNMLGAFTLGAFFAGVAGGIYASYVSFIAPTSFTMWLSIYALIYVVVGGVKYFSGAIVGAATLTILPVAVSWSDTYVAIFAAAITLVILMVLPDGVVSEAVDRVRPGMGYQSADESDRSVGHTAAPTAAGPGTTSSPSAAAAPSEAALLEVRELRVHFGGVKAVDGVSFALCKGEVLGIIGPNGAGKTTLFNAISGFVRPTSGQVLLHGRVINGVAPHRIVAGGLTRTYQSAAVFENLTVFENVLAACRPAKPALKDYFIPLSADRKSQQRTRQILETFALEEWAGSLAKSVPYGLGRQLGMAIAFATNPQVLCLDEPMAGLSDSEAAAMVAVIRRLKEMSDLSLVLIEHRVPVVRQLCDRLVAVNFGQVIAAGSTQEVLSSADVIESYLGEAEESADV